jgi:hypothetical protein
MHHNRNFIYNINNKKTTVERDRLHLGTVSSCSTCRAFQVDWRQLVAPAMACQRCAVGFAARNGTAFPPQDFNPESHVGFGGQATLKPCKFFGRSNKMMKKSTPLLTRSWLEEQTCAGFVQHICADEDAVCVCHQCTARATAYCLNLNTY